MPDFDGDLKIRLRLFEHMERRIFWMGYYNLDIVAWLDKYLRKGMNVIDVGANIGEISLVSAKRVGESGKVIAFEPINDIADELQANIERNRLHQLKLERMGLSDAICDDVPIYASCGQRDANDEHRGLGSLFGAEAEGIPIQHISITTLDAWISANPVERLDLIKIDIEGAELPCLMGAQRTIRRFKPQLIIEVQDQSASVAGYKARDILDFLAPLGYEFQRIGRKGRLAPLRAENLTGYQNVLCIPTRKT